MPEANRASQILSAERAHQILRRISDEDCYALGLDPKWARPDWMILTVFPIPPPAVRPSVMMDTTRRAEVSPPLPSVVSVTSALRDACKPFVTALAISLLLFPLSHSVVIRTTSLTSWPTS